MRELKFRAWDSVSKQFVMLEITSGNEFVEVQKPDNMDLPFQPKGRFESLEWQQFTGIKDHAGKDIFEGDIIAGGWVVTWHNGGLRMHLPNIFEGTTYLDFSPSMECEVIGNVYENPELLDKS